MTDACNVCGETSSLMNCSRCKSVAYCSTGDCQRRDWKSHKPLCIRREFAGAPCDRCGSTEDVEHGHTCLDCGSLFCEACSNQLKTRDLSGKIVSFEPCPRCNKTRNYSRFSDHKKLEKLIKESPRDPRLSQWLVALGNIFLHFDNTRKGEQKAKERYLRAGKLGYGEGFARIAEIYINHRNWDEARRYYRMAADRMNVIAICNLATAAGQGYFTQGDIIQEDQRREPDLEEAFRLYREGARLGHVTCCGMLGQFYLGGFGTEVNLDKGFKWSRKAAERGDTRGMHECAECYLFGRGVEQSNEQATYWYEKYLEIEDDESAQNNLDMLRRL